MNYAGVRLLISRGIIPVNKAVFFRVLEEIPKEFIESYNSNNETLWIRAFDDRVKITDHPYKTKSPFHGNFSVEKLRDKFDSLQGRMENLGVPLSNRIFMFGTGWTDPEVEFSGHAYFHEGIVDMGIRMGAKPHARDWSPDLSLRIPVHNNRAMLSNDDLNGLDDYIIDICRTILSLHEGSYIDFTKLKNGQFFYHDLSIHD
jgi:hypothetical protein